MSTDISQNRTVTARQLKKALEFCIRAKRPVFVWGAPGIGKSSIAQQICDERNGKLYDMRLGQCELTDLRGMPYFDKDSKQMLWAPPVDLPNAQEAAEYPFTMLFLDEMNTAAPAVQAAAFQVVLDRKVGTYSLPDNTFVIAAGNRESDRSVVSRMPTPLANRFVHLELRVDFDSWQEWAMMNTIHPDVVGFLSFSKNSLNDFDPKSPSKAFATPRSWEFVSQLVYESGLDEITAMDLISGTIGEGLALKFMAHRKLAADLPNPSEILSGKEKELKSKEISAMYSLATSCAYELRDFLEACKKNKEEAKWHEAGDNVLGYFMANFTPEITISSMITMLQQYNLPFHPGKMKNFKPFQDKYGKLLLKSSSMG